MTYVLVAVDAIEVATIDIEGRDVVAIHVGGARSDADYADLGVTGGVYDTEGITDHRIWIDQLPLRAGQVIEVAFVASGVQTSEGDRLSDLYPNSVDADLRHIDPRELAKEERLAAKIRDHYEVKTTTTSGGATTLITSSDEHGFGFHALWSKWNPDKISVSLHAYTIDSVANEEPGRYVAREKMSVGEAARLELVG